MKKDPDDKIRLNKDLQKEKWKRDIYVRWTAEIKKRMEEGSCPRCATIKWIQRGEGFHKTWMCDKCGLIITKRDWILKDVWWDYIKLLATKEIKRIEKMRRHNQSIRTYESDGV